MVPEAGNTGKWLRPKKCLLAAQRIALAETVLAAEFVDPATGIDNFLLAGIKRMTCRADLDCEVLTECTSGFEFVAATTGYVDITVIGMDFGFHLRSSLRDKRMKKGA
jgi:hypothetical protein